VPLKGVIELEALDDWFFLSVNNHEIGITFADVNAHVKRFHCEASFYGKKWYQESSSL